MNSFFPYVTNRTKNFASKLPAITTILLTRIMGAGGGICAAMSLSQPWLANETLEQAETVVAPIAIGCMTLALMEFGWNAWRSQHLAPEAPTTSNKKIAVSLPLLLHHLLDFVREVPGFAGPFLAYDEMLNQIIRYRTHGNDTVMTVAQIGLTIATLRYLFKVLIETYPETASKGMHAIANPFSGCHSATLNRRIGEACCFILTVLGAAAANWSVPQVAFGVRDENNSDLFALINLFIISPTACFYFVEPYYPKSEYSGFSSTRKINARCGITRKIPERHNSVRPQPSPPNASC